MYTVHKEEGVICTEEKGKVVAAAWETELIQFLAMLAILYKDDLKNRMVCTRTIEDIQFFNSSWCKIASVVRN